jgi:HK97 family phage prohead protease
MSRGFSKDLSNREIETRGTALAVELRGSGSRKIGGYASVFEKRSQNLGGFVEVVEKSAFKRTLGDGGNVFCRFEHETLLGTTAAGTLQLNVDARGLDYVCEVPFSREDVLELVARGDIRNSSFSFQAMEQAWSHDLGYPVRHLVAVRLIDVAPVTIPAYEDATVALRSLGIQFDAPVEEIYDMARDRELSKLFVRTDDRGPQKTRAGAGAQALAKLAAMTHDEKRRRSWHQAQVELMAMVEPGDRPLTDKQQAVEDMRYLTPRQKVVKTYEMQDDWEVGQ